MEKNALLVNHRFGSLAALEPIVRERLVTWVQPPFSVGSSEFSDLSARFHQTRSFTAHELTDCFAPGRGRWASGKPI